MEEDLSAAAVDLAAIAAAVDKPASGSYCVRYVGNNSKKWDGKEVLVEKEFLESLHPFSNLKSAFPTRDCEGLEWGSGNPKPHTHPSCSSYTKSSYTKRYV